MKVELDVKTGAVHGLLNVTREKGDTNHYTESTLLHYIKLALIEKGFDVIKKRMWKDGHMMNGDDIQYIRSRKINPTRVDKWLDAMYIYDEQYALRNLVTAYNNLGGITLAVMYPNRED